MGGERVILVPVDDGAAEPVRQHALKRCCDGAFLDEAFDGPVAAVAIDVDERHVAELGVHIADPRHRRAVVEHAANEQHVAALEGKIAARS